MCYMHTSFFVKYINAHTHARTYTHTTNRVIGSYIAQMWFVLHFNESFSKMVEISIYILNYNVIEQAWVVNGFSLQLLE